jgi:ligand-binding sensor protein/AraC-like DNA-binding protein
MNNPYMLDKILNIEKWQKLQDSLALITGLAIITVDYKGVPITRHSSRRDFCGHIRNNPSLFKLCQKCDSRGGLEAVRISSPYIYKCHCGIVDIAIPIIVDNQYIGAIMAGEVKIDDSDIEENLETIYTHESSNEIASSLEFKTAYDSIPVISYKKLKTSVQMLFELCNYLVEEAMNKNVILDMYEKLSGNNSLINSDILPPDSVKKIRYELGSALTSAYIKSSAAETPQCTNKTLLPAFVYMNEHRNVMLSQKDAADLCHISTGHFSRLFLKETKENYSVFYMRLKVEWAKNLLQKTDLPVSQISEELGFNEPSYFTKVFHKYEGVTPAYYRKTARSED